MDIRQRHGFSKDDFIYLYVGRIAKEKNIDLLIETFKNAYQKNQNLKLLVVGLGDYQKKLGEIAGVVFAGAVKAEELYYYYNQADCFVSASTSETLGLVFAEALYCETPVLGIDSPGVRDVVKDGINGELATGVKEFKKVFVEIPTKPSDIKRYKALAKESAQNFTANVNLIKILELYKKSKK